MVKRKLTKKQYKEKEKKNEAKKRQTELNLPKIPKLSQSLIKALFNYKENKACGILIEKQYVEGIYFPSNEVQELGNYFEYICTGALPRDNHIPEPKLLKTGKPTLSYARMDKQKENFELMMKEYNFEIEKVGFAFTNPKYSGIADIIAKNEDGDRVIIDCKTTGLINDKWSEYGWADESMEERWNLNVQAIHYKILAKYEWGIEDIPFYFMVFSNKNDWECKIFEIIVDESTRFQHYQNLERIKIYLDEQLKIGFQAKPELMRCKKCPLFDSCLWAINVPNLQKVYI